MRRLHVVVAVLRSLVWIMLLGFAIVTVVNHERRILSAESAPQQTVALLMTLLEFVSGWVLAFAADGILRVAAGRKPSTP